MWRVLIGPLLAAALSALSGDQLLAPKSSSPPDAVRAGLERWIAAREYEASETPRGLQAPNRAQNLRTYFEKSGVRVVDRTDPQAPELVRLTLRGVGRGAELAPVPEGELAPSGARVEIRRAALTEWYENRPEGLEQGFQLRERPAGSGELVVEVSLADAGATQVGSDVVLRASSGRTLRYGDLHAEDSGGRTVPARLELAAPDRLRLVLDDAAAKYPVAIDPLLTGSPDTVVHGPSHGNGPFDVSLGFSLASAGDVNGDGYADVIVGAPYFDGGTPYGGGAFIFQGGPGGIPSGDPFLGGIPVASTTLASSQYFSAFGAAVASAGDVNGDGYSDVIVGAPAWDGTYANEGAAFIYLGGPAGIQTTAATTLLGDQVGDGTLATPGGFLGTSVASAGDVNGDGYDDVIVAAERYSAGSTVGAVFVFLGGASGVTSSGPSSAATRITLAPGETDANNQFGHSVAPAGDVNGDGYADIVVTVPSYQVPSAPLSSGAFIFLGSASGIANATTQTAATRLVAPSLAQCAAAAGDVNGDGYGDVIVGNAGYGMGGAAFIYQGGPGGIASGSDLTASTTLTSSVAGANFGGVGTEPFYVFAGGCVAGAGDVNGDGYADVLVSATGYGPTGSAFVFAGGPGGIPSGTEATALATIPAAEPTGTPSQGFAAAVAGAGYVNGDGFDDIAVGVPRYASAAGLSGAFYTYLGGSKIRTSAANANARVDATNGALGSSVASAGDVNGDGYSDVIVGAHYYDAGQPEEGAAFIFHGGPTGIQPLSSPASANTVLHSGQAYAHFAESVASAGDVNGDGYSDVIVGAPMYDDAGVTDEGSAFVFLGGPGGVTSSTAATASASFHSLQGGSRFGWSVASAGDVNGDGRSDVIIGAPLYTSAFSLEGAAFVYLSGPAGLANGSASSASTTLRGNQTAATLGLSVASAGDVNGDGYGDVVVGAPLYDVPLITDGGGVGVWFGGPSGISSGTLATAPMRIDGDNPSSLFGYSVAGAGDVNGDGFDDVIAGSPAAGFSGRAYLYAGSATPPASQNASAATTQFLSTDPGYVFGASVAGAGDLNGDGFADLVIGSAYVSTGSSNGEAFIVHGQASLPLSEQGTLLTGETTTQRFGASVAGAGDVNGDGFADLVIGAPDRLDGSGVSVGAAYLFYGNGASGHPVLTRQLRGNGSGVLVSPLGDSWRADGFELRIRAHHPSGSGRLRAELQTCPSGLGFGAPGCVITRSAWQTETAATATPELSVSPVGLPASTALHWRARALFADLTGPLPANPAHGPWRAFQGAVKAASLRTSSSADSDADGVPNSVDDCPYRANPGQQDTGGFGAGSPPDGIGDACQCGNVAGSGAVDTADVVAYRQYLANPSGAPLSPDAIARCTVLGTGAACNVLQVSAIRRGLQVPPLAPIASAAAAQVCAASHP